MMKFMTDSQGRPLLDYTVHNKCWLSAGYPEGHIISFSMPSPHDPKGFIMNWGLYAKAPPDLEPITSMKVVRSLSPESLAYFRSITKDAMPPFFDQMTQIKEDHISFHPIFDDSPSTFIHPSKRLLLMGDAGAVLRPHTASGSMKAIQDAMALRELLLSGNDDANDASELSWDDVCDAYNEARCAEARQLVTLGQRLGEFLVTNVPPWDKMSPSDYEEWSKIMMSGQSSSSYLWNKDTTKEQ